MSSKNSDEIWTIPDLLHPPECGQLIEFAERLGFAAAPVSTHGGPQMLPNLRNNDRVMIDDSAQAGKLWRRIRDHLPKTIDGYGVVGLNERLRFYRYQEGQAFEWHRDGFFELPGGDRSQLTVLVYLSDDFLGGQTEFLTTCIKPPRGSGVVFPHHLLHRGAPVQRGRKYVLRTDVMCTPIQRR